MEKSPYICYIPQPAALKYAGCACISGVCGEAVRSICSQRQWFLKTKLPEDRKCWPERFSVGLCIYALVSMTESILLSRGAIVVAMEPK